ncbi:hypothetical protein FOZ61_002818 [Perkinsus olseni]|uniref:Uncharacterized protein n=1 Tax=Perkinsus olseni TaxID=32597 RepID=A0A7J6LS03_PEROL|nr:hypothetical protein FOZ61_002818 [Perkinsus olseni]
MKLVDDITITSNVCTAEKLSCRRSKSANGAVLEREGPYEGGNFGILVHIPLDRPKPGGEARWHQPMTRNTSHQKSLAQTSVPRSQLSQTRIKNITWDYKA